MTAPRITAVRTHHLRHALTQKFQSAFNTFHDRQACLVEIEAEGGLTGWGECLGPASINVAIVAAMTPLLIGRDARDIEVIWLDLYNHFRDQGQRGATMTAQSGIDIALWDLVGKYHGEPIHKVMGGAFRDHVPAYATGGFRPVGLDRDATLREELTARIAEGFSAHKIKIGYGVKADITSIAVARDTIGPDAHLMIDANHGYDEGEAAEVGQAVAHFGIDWFEEPVTPEHLAAYRSLRHRQPIPVAGGETWHGRWAFRDAIEAEAVDILQPDVCGCGGMTEMRKIYAMAEVAAVRVVPHVWGTGIAVAAALQILAILPYHPPRHEPRAPWLEFDQTPNPLRDDILCAPFRHQNGIVAVPDGPGLGVEVNAAALAAFRV